MFDIHVRGLPIARAEDEIAALWQYLEEYGVSTPDIRFYFSSDELIDIHIRFHERPKPNLPAQKAASRPADAAVALWAARSQSACDLPLLPARRRNGAPSRPRPQLGMTSAQWS